MDVTTAVVGEAVDAGAAAVLRVAGGPEGELFGMLRVFLQGEDVDAAGCGFKVLGCGSMQEGQAVAVGHDHQIVTDLNLGSGHIGINLRVHHRHILHVAGIGRIGHVQNLHAVAEEAAAVEIVFSVFGFVELGLEEVVVVTVVMGQNLHVLDIALVAGALGVEFLAHCGASL